MMADPISLASGLLALATFALQSSVTLYSTIRSYQNHPKQVRDLNEELEALSGVLRSLTGTVGATTGVDLSALDLPLLRCGNACKDFEAELQKCTSRSGGSRTSFRDWAKLQYMGNDINGFKQVLAGYKSTITVALTDANLRQSSVTAENIEGYKTLIKDATNDLEDHLQDMEEKLDTLVARSQPASGSDAAELQLLKDEKLSTQRCLQICAQLAEHISQIQIRPPQGNRASPVPIDPETVPERVVNEGLQECKNSLTLAAAKLEMHMQDVIEKLVTKSKTTMASEEDAAQLVKLQDEWATTRQCINICSKAENHLSENISIIDNYATGDETIQFLVSTDGQVIHGKNRGYGYRIGQVGGHMNNESVQQLSRDLSYNSRNAANQSPHPQGNTSAGAKEATENEPNPEFGERYGPGFKLPSKPTPETASSAKRPAGGETSKAPKHDGAKPRTT